MTKYCCFPNFNYNFLIKFKSDDFVKECPIEIEKYINSTINKKNNNVRNEIISILNKMTPTNFDILIKKIKEINILNIILFKNEFINIVISKAISDEIYCKLYASLFLNLNHIDLNNSLVIQCIDVFNDYVIKHVFNIDNEFNIKKKINSDCFFIFIGELFNNNIFSYENLLSILNNLLDQITNENNLFFISNICTLINIIKYKIIKSPTKSTIINILQKLKSLTNIDKRSHFFILNSIDEFNIVP